MDRTSDFVGITVLFETGQARPQTHRPLSRDARLAQQISDQLRQQELCLRELQGLVGKKSIIGDDPSAQIATLTDVLKKELGTAERSIQLFQQTVNAQRGRHQQHHQAHFGIVCQSLKSRCAKSVKTFHQALQQHTAAIRERSSRRSKFSHGGGNPMVHINAPLFSRTGAAGVNGHQVLPTNNGAPLQPLRHQPPGQSAAGSGFQAPPAPTPTKPGAAPALSPPAPGAGLRRRANLGASPFMQQRTTPPWSGAGVQQQQYRPREDAQTRYNNAAQVESTIVEITGMYTRMATMVAEQGEIISRIDDDMDVAQTNVEAAHGELLKLFNMVQGNRSLILKIFLVLILVIFLFVVVF
ncbi:Syntaxin-5 [Phytophthora pseudosyringae]|uniref:Syntaxin-5 n=1 Tax=Phytophthora pseudosyringae TaxID=221518 RepID=A0A8T1WJR8_9STRA|nr:Syntaxin-5 [Phytophthora pseudosyringae]